MEERREQLVVDGFLDSAVYWLTPDGHIASWNPGAERLKGYRACEIIGEHFSCFYCAEDVQRGIPEWLLRVAAAEGRAEDEGWRLRKGGARFWASVVMTALRDDAGELRGFVKVTRDMTSPRQMTDSLQRLREQRDVEERKRLLDEERQNIAHDRHERVEQAFFAVGLAATNAIGLARASTVVRLPVVDSLVDALSQVNDLAATGADQLHAAMFALNHAEVVGRGLVPSLSRLVKEFRGRTGIDADIVLTGSEKRLQTDVAEALYAAAREALANVERHSNASAVLLALHIGGWSVRLTIQDDGTGAVSGADGVTASGLHRVAERVLRLNGSFSAGPNAEGGFLVRTYLPLSLSGG
jgi:PAS domain S-box-containing protein